MRAWVLNLDAEDELRLGAPRTPSAADRARRTAIAARLRGNLVPDGDLVLTDGRADGCEGRAWCPTPAARARLRAAGATLPDAPPLATLRAVNHRAWAAGLGLALPGARWLPDADVLARHLEAPWPARGWLLKRPLGYAGRGRLHLRTRDELDDPRHAGWIRNALADDGVLAEPFVAITLELGRHGWIGDETVRGARTRQTCDARGAWVSTSLLEEDLLSRSEIETLDENYEETAAALRAAGYRGPFGVDAYLWEDDAGRRRLQPRGEVNARYGMGWAVGMGSLRPDLALTAR